MKGWASAVKDLPQPQSVWHFHPSGFVGRSRKHAGRDLYTDALEAVYAITSRKVISVRNSYLGRWQVTVEHDYVYIKGYKMVLRHDKLDASCLGVKTGEGLKTYMLHILGKRVEH